MGVPRGLPRVCWGWGRGGRGWLLRGHRANAQFKAESFEHFIEQASCVHLQIQKSHNTCKTWKEQPCRCTCTIQYMLFFEQPAHGPQGLHSSQRRDFCCLTHVVAWSHAHTLGATLPQLWNAWSAQSRLNHFSFTIGVHRELPKIGREWRKLTMHERSERTDSWDWEEDSSASKDWRIGHQSRPKKDKNSHDSLYVRVFQPQFLYCECNRVQFKRAIQNRYCTGTTAWRARGPFF